jgi:FHS family L-fucose permease-like MFS transporter
LLFFGSLAPGAKLENIESVKTPYLILGLAFIIVALLFKFSSLPNKIENLKTETASGNERKSALKYPQLVLGMIAIFIYVGVEVSTVSNLPEFMRQHLHTSTDQIAPYVSLFWASLMIGRWTAAAGAFDVKSKTREVLKFIMPYLAFGVFLLANYIAGHNLEPFYLYGFIIMIMIALELLSFGNPARQLLLFSFAGVVALIIGMLYDGIVSVYAFTSVGLFCSTLWPCIFTLAIAGLGKHTNQRSSFLIMMIMGGGFISLLQGWLAHESLLGIQWSYLVGVGCFLYLAFYGWKVTFILKEQGIEYNRAVKTSGK